MSERCPSVDAHPPYTFMYILTQLSSEGGRDLTGQVYHNGAKNHRETSSRRVREKLKAEQDSTEWGDAFHAMPPHGGAFLSKHIHPMSPIGVFDHVGSCEWAALREKLEMQHMVIDATLADMGVDPPHPLSQPPSLLHTPSLSHSQSLALSGACVFLGAFSMSFSRSASPSFAPRPFATFLLSPAPSWSACGPGRSRRGELCRRGRV
jgi:hypothetical protein